MSPKQILCLAWRRAAERVGASHFGADRHETGEQRAQRMVMEEIKRLGWEIGSSTE